MKVTANSFGVYGLTLLSVDGQPISTIC